MAQNDLYNEETISKAINTKWAGKTVHFAKETDSTNSWIKRLAKEGTVCCRCFPVRHTYSVR